MGNGGLCMGTWTTTQTWAHRWACRRTTRCSGRGGAVGMSCRGIAEKRPAADLGCSAYVRRVEGVVPGGTEAPSDGHGCGVTDALLHGSRPAVRGWSGSRGNGAHVAERRNAVESGGASMRPRAAGQDGPAWVGADCVRPCGAAWLQALRTVRLSVGAAGRWAWQAWQGSERTLHTGTCRSNYARPNNALELTSAAWQDGAALAAQRGRSTDKESVAVALADPLLRGLSERVRRVA